MASVCRQPASALQHAAAALGMKIGELAEQQTALAKQQAALAEQQAALAEQQQAAGQEVAELKAQHSVMAQQLGDMQVCHYASQLKSTAAQYEMGVLPPCPPHKAARKNCAFLAASVVWQSADQSSL